MATNAYETYRSSDLSRASAHVFTAASDHPVMGTRRDGEPLVLMSESEDHARNELLQLADQLLGVTTEDDTNLVRAMSDRFPWMLALTPDDQEACARDVLDTARASFAMAQAHLTLSTLASWRETAETIAAGLGQTPVEWIDDDEPVERP